MWRPVVQTTPPTEPAVSIDTVKTDLINEDTSDDARIARATAAAIARVEAITGTRLAAQTVTVACTDWADLARLPVAPVNEVEAIVYVDAEGGEETLSSATYEARLEGLEPEIVLAHGQSWPTRRPGSLITLTLAAGYAADGTPLPADVTDAVLVLAAASIDAGDTAAAERAALSLLTNHRLGAA